jgi:hypothetical protein
MTDDERGHPASGGQDGRPTDRESPVGEPVVRGDPAVLGGQADDAVQFDPEDPDSVAAAADTVRTFADDDAGDDNVSVLRGAAAGAALARAGGSNPGAAARAAGETTVSFIRKWARVHDLPYAVRKQVATGHIAPSAAKHVARLSGDARLHLAWALLDADLTVREVRTVASAVADGADVDDAMQDVGVTPGRISVELPPGPYLELRRQAALADREPDELVAAALSEYLSASEKRDDPR